MPQTIPVTGTPGNREPPIPQSASQPAAKPDPQALLPNHQQQPWEPTLYADATQDEKTADAQYAATYGGHPATSPLPEKDAPPPSGPPLLSSYTDPDLTMAYYTSPDLIPTAPPAPPDLMPADGIPAPPATTPPAADLLDPAFSIDLAAARATEQTCLNTVNVMIGAYQTLNSQVAAAASSPSIFGQNAGYQQSYVATSTSDGQPQTFGTEVVYDILDQESTQFYNTMIPQLQLAVKQAAQTLENAGQYLAQYSNALELYAYTDNTSAFPPPP